MKLLINIISQRLRRWYYYQELKTLSTIAFFVFIIWFVKIYGLAIGKWAVSSNGIIYAMFLLASLVLGLTLKLFYRMMVIKYHEKSTEIVLFKFINDENN